MSTPPIFRSFFEHPLYDANLWGVIAGFYGNSPQIEGGERQAITSALSTILLSLDYCSVSSLNDARVAVLLQQKDRIGFQELLNIKSVKSDRKLLVNLIETERLSKEQLEGILYKFIGLGDYDMVRRILEKGIPPQHLHDPLVAAAGKGHLDSVLDILECLEKFDILENYFIYLGFALQRAAAKNHLHIVQTLLEKGCISNAYCDAALSNAAKNGYLDITRVILEHLKKNKDRRPRDRHPILSCHYGAEALRYAAEKGHLNVVQAILENGSILDEDRGRALRYAAEKGHLDVARALQKKPPYRLILTALAAIAVPVVGYFLHRLRN